MHSSNFTTRALCGKSETSRGRSLFEVEVDLSKRLNQISPDEMDTEFVCPSCQQPLTEVRTSNGIFWSCEKCGGCAVGVELLRRTFTSESINPLWFHALRGEGQTGRNCPACRNPMTEVKLSDDAGIKVDVCRLCHFVWFDATEVENLVPRSVSPPKPELPQKAREAIALAKVQQLAEQARGTDFDSSPPDEWWKEIAAFLGMPIELDAAPQARTPWATWTLCLAIILREHLCVYAASRNRAAFRIDPGASIAPRRPHISDVIFSSRGRPASRWQHLFPVRLRR